LEWISIAVAVPLLSHMVLNVEHLTEYVRFVVGAPVVGALVGYNAVLRVNTDNRLQHDEDGKKLERTAPHHSRLSRSNVEDIEMNETF
jgi:hypothetical protein